MKANELMIGDLVYLIHTEDNIAPYKEEIRIEADDLSRDACILEAHYEPIPLTPEILEKNGAKHFVYEHPYFDYVPTEEELNDELQYYPFHSYTLGTNIRIAFYPKEIRVEVFGQDFVDMFKIRGRKGDVYVHELQHALRLCGIDKEITLRI